MLLLKHRRMCSNRTRGSAEPTQPKQFIAHFYVAEDIQKRGALDIKEFHSLEDALNAYHKLPNNQRKALGAMNTEALPGSLDFVQCLDGKDTIIQDYTKVAGWQNAEVLNSIAPDRTISQHQRSCVCSCGECVPIEHAGRTGQRPL